METLEKTTLELQGVVIEKKIRRGIFFFRPSYCVLRLALNENSIEKMSFFDIKGPKGEKLKEIEVSVISKPELSKSIRIKDSIQIIIEVLEPE